MAAMFALSENSEADAPRCSTSPLRTLRQDFGCSESYEDRDPDYFAFSKQTPYDRPKSGEGLNKNHQLAERPDIERYP
jgi:hypothetical protein